MFTRTSLLLTVVLFCSIFLLPFTGVAQVTCDPVFPTADDLVTITYDASKGNGALAGVAPVYAHMGVITDKSTSPTDWKYVATTWGSTDSKAQMNLSSPNVWKKTYQIRSFYGIPANEKVLKLSFVFRNAAGNIVGRASDGGDIFYDVYPPGAALQTKFINPDKTSLLTQTGANIAVKAAASKAADLKLYDNGTQVGSASGVNLETTITAGGVGLHDVMFIATAGAEKDTSAFQYFVASPVLTENPPAGTQAGITYLSNNSVRLAFVAPKRQIVHVIGDFNDWKITSQYQMRKSVDGNIWWIDITGLPVNQYTKFQYLSDGTQRFADPLSTLVLDPGNDGFITAATFPNLPAYPTGKTTGMVSVIRPGEPAFNWTATNYQRPKNEELIIYETLIRDFINTRNYQTMLDTLDYLEKLGVTAIQFMPVNEFDGNLSWGYNPSFHKALDKYYGSPELFKRFIDECHKRNIAVIVDVVFNHVTGTSPLAQLFWDAAKNQPSADNPWLNPTARHEFNVFNDFNHESALTKDYVKNCLEYWIKEYRVDGFRFDLSKGFTQKNTIGNVGAWGQYDATRVALWKEYANFMWSVDPKCYVILEHFADNTEEKELAEAGMMLWGNLNGSFRDIAKGSNVNADLRWLSHVQRGWNKAHAIGYAESHDEERMGYDSRVSGTTSGGYLINTLPVYTRRIEALNNILLCVPGPKMLWQFQELAYDFSINTCEDGTVKGDCRLSNKPVRWDYFQEPNRRRLYNVTAALLQLRKKTDVFETTDFQANIGSSSTRTIRLNSANLNAVLMANVGTSQQNVTATFPTNGIWYDYYTGREFTVANTTLTQSLKAGEYLLLLDKKVPLPPGIVLSAPEVSGLLSDLAAWPNPVNDQVFLQFALEERSDIRIEITDASGRMVRQIVAGELPAGEQQVEIEAMAWPAGVYFVNVFDSKGGRLNKKVMKF